MATSVDGTMLASATSLAGSDVREARPARCTRGGLASCPKTVPKTALCGKEGRKERRAAICEAAVVLHGTEVVCIRYGRRWVRLEGATPTHRKLHYPQHCSVVTDLFCLSFFFFFCRGLVGSSGRRLAGEIKMMFLLLVYTK